MENGAPSWSQVRARFPVARGGLAYLDTASYGPLPEPVVRAVTELVAATSEGRGDWRDWERAGEEARAGLARLLGVEPGTVALLPALSVAAAQVAESLPARNARGRRANLVVGDQEFRSNLFPWLNQERRGLEVRLVPFRDGRIAAADLIAAMDESTVLVAVSHVQSANGYRVELAPLVAACAESGARLFLDATQSLGALRVPTDGVHYVAGAGYKWLLAPRGVAFLCVSPAVEPMAPLAPGWKTPADPYAGYYGAPLDPPADATRYDVSLAWPCWVGAAGALALLNELGSERIEARDLALAARFRAGLPAVGLASLFAEEESSQIVGLRVPDPAAASIALRERGVVAAVRGSYLRASFHFFNDEEDVDRGLAALAAATRAGAGSV